MLGVWCGVSLVVCAAGGIPDAVLKYCVNHKDLGIHSEMFSDGIVDLVESGVGELLADGRVEPAASAQSPVMMCVAPAPPRAPSAVTGIHKKHHPGLVIGGFAFGSDRLYKFMHNNSQIEMLDIEHVNDTAGEDVAQHVAMPRGCRCNG